MIGSTINKFIFFHVPKASGTSIIKALTAKAEINFGRPSSHLTPKDFKKMNLEVKKGKPVVSGEKILKDFTTFAFVRNPWDLQVSLYHYMKGYKGHLQHEEIKDLNFNQYVDWRVLNPNKNQCDFLSVFDNSIPNIDFIGKMEFINPDFEFITKKLGITVKLPHLNKTTHNDYKEYYGDSDIKKISELHKKDIECFGYNFENKFLKSGKEIFENENSINIH